MRGTGVDLWKSPGAKTTSELVFLGQLPKTTSEVVSVVGDFHRSTPVPLVRRSSGGCGVGANDGGELRRDESGDRQLMTLGHRV